MTSFHGIKGKEPSPERRNFEQLYDDLLKPMIAKSKYVEQKPLMEKEMIQNIKKWHEEQKQERNKTYSKVR